MAKVHSQSDVYSQETYDTYTDLMSILLRNAASPDKGIKDEAILCFAAFARLSKNHPPIKAAITEAVKRQMIAEAATASQKTRHQLLASLVFLNPTMFAGAKGDPKAISPRPALGQPAQQAGVA